MLDLKKLFIKILGCCYKQTTDGIWTIRRYADGTAECWGYKLTSGTFSSWGNGYSHDIAAENYPSGLFVSFPICVATAKCSSANTVCGINSSGGTQTQTPGLTLLRMTAYSGTPNFQAFYHAWGKWK